MKFVAPAEISHFEFDNVEYKRDENGHFDIRHPDHIASARMHGATPVIEGAINPIAPTADEKDARIAELEARLASGPVVDERDARIAELEAQLAARDGAAPEQATETQDAPEGTDAPGDTADAPGDTSEATGGPAPIDLDTASRDDMVAWLAANGVTISPASSKDVARAAVEDVLKGE